MEQQPVISEWWDSLTRYAQNNGFPARGTIAGSLVIIDRLQTTLELDIAAHLTPGGGQIRSVSGAIVDKILERYGEPPGFLVEVRTNRGLIGEIKGLLERLTELGIADLPVVERHQVLEDVKLFWTLASAPRLARERLGTR